jgi:peptide-methionine (S)-S-oxide reductase
MRSIAKHFERDIHLAAAIAMALSLAAALPACRQASRERPEPARDDDTDTNPSEVSTMQDSQGVLVKSTPHADPEASGRSRAEIATFAAGCFWGVESTFRQQPGVLATAVGYTGGHVESPSYQQVCAGETGHAEAVRVVFDPTQISYEELLELFWNCHDPTTPNRQGPDIGEQYRSAIFCHGDQQCTAAGESRDRLEASGRHARPVVTQIEPAGPFYRAEEYHQQYLAKRGLEKCSGDACGPGG